MKFVENKLIAKLAHEYLSGNEFGNSMKTLLPDFKLNFLLILFSVECRSIVKLFYFYA